MGKLIGIVWIVAAILSFIGCSDDSATDPSPADPKAEVESVHLARLGDFLAERATEYAASFSGEAVELCGGDPLDPSLLTAAYYEALFASAQFDALRGKSVAEIVDPAMTVVLTRAEAEELYGPELGCSQGYDMLDADLLAYTPPLEGSALFDGWAAAYRKIGGVWLVAALD